MEKLPDTIEISWHIDDLKGLVEDNNIPVDGLSDDDYREILQIAKRQHDACSGINWDVLEVHIEWYARDHGKYKE